MTSRGAPHFIFHSSCVVGDLSSCRFLACNLERMFARWNLTVLTRIGAQQLFEIGFRKAVLHNGTNLEGRS